MDKNIQKRKTEEEREKIEPKRKEINLTRTLSSGKRVKSSLDGEASTSRESENSLAEDPTYKSIVAYYAQKNVAENIRANEFYSLIKNEHLKHFHEFLDDYREVIHHACYADDCTINNAFHDYIEEYKKLNEKIKKEIDNYELNPIARLERHVEKLEESDVRLEKREEDIIAWKEEEKLKTMDKFFSFIMEGEMGIAIPLQHLHYMEGKYGERSKYQKEHEKRKVKLILIKNYYCQKIKRKLEVLSRLVPDAQKLVRDAQELSDCIKSLLDRHRRQWESMVEKLELQRKGALEGLELPKQIVSPDMVKKLKELEQRISCIQDKWEKREKQYQEGDIRGDNRLWNYVHERLLEVSLDQLDKMKNFNDTFEKIKIGKVGDFADLSEVPNLISMAEDIRNDIKFRIILLNKDEEYKDNIINKSERTIKDFITNARYFGFSGYKNAKNN
jgi:hypothetical protein